MCDDEVEGLFQHFDRSGGGEIDLRRDTIARVHFERFKT